MPRLLHLIFLVGISLWTPAEIDATYRDAARAVAEWNQFYPQQIEIVDLDVQRGTLDAATDFSQAWHWSDAYPRRGDGITVYLSRGMGYCGYARPDYIAVNALRCDTMTAILHELGHAMRISTQE